MNKYAGVAILAALVAVMVVASVDMYARWQRDQYFGEILRVSGSDVVLRETRLGERVVRIAPTTEIRRGSREASLPLTAGERVIVFGEEREGIIQASLVRVVEDGDWRGGVEQR